MDRSREESDQRPEEGPGEQVPQDAGGTYREEADESAGGRDNGDSEPGEATGNPPDAD